MAHVHFAGVEQQAGRRAVDDEPKQQAREVGFDHFREVMDRLTVLERSIAAKDLEIERLRQIVAVQKQINQDDDEAVKMRLKLLDSAHREGIQELQSALEAKQQENARLSQRLDEQHKLLARVEGLSANSHAKQTGTDLQAAATEPERRSQGPQQSQMVQELYEILQALLFESRMSLVEFQEVKMDSRRLCKANQALKQDLAALRGEVNRVRGSLKSALQEKSSLKEELAIERAKFKLAAGTRSSQDKKVSGDDQSELDFSELNLDQRTDTNTNSRRSSLDMKGSRRNSLVMSRTDKPMTPTPGTFDPASAKKHLVSGNNFSGKTKLGLNDDDLNQCVQQ